MRVHRLAVPLLALCIAVPAAARADGFLNAGPAGAFLNLGTGGAQAVVPMGGGVATIPPHPLPSALLLDGGSPILPVSGRVAAGPVPGSLLAVQLAAARRGGAVVLARTGSGAVRPLVIPPGALPDRR